MSRVGAQRNAAFRERHEMQTRDTTGKIDGSKTSYPFEKVGSMTSTS